MRSIMTLSVERYRGTDCQNRPAQTFCAGCRLMNCAGRLGLRSVHFEPVVATNGFLYEHLADELGQAIDRGALRAGDRLPSVRRLAQERSVSVATVLEAYLRLENAGLIEVRPKSGHFVRRRLTLTPEPRAPRACTT